MDTKLFLMLVLVFLLGYYSSNICNGLVEGLTCGGEKCLNDYPNAVCIPPIFIDKETCPCGKQTTDKDGYSTFGTPPCCTNHIEVAGKCYANPTTNINPYGNIINLRDVTSK